MHGFAVCCVWADIFSLCGLAGILNNLLTVVPHFVAFCVHLPGYHFAEADYNLRQKKAEEKPSSLSLHSWQLYCCATTTHLCKA